MPDKQIDILLKLRSDIRELQDLETGVKGVVRNLQRGISIGLGLDLVNSVQRIPQLLFSGARAGVQFNSTIEQNQIAFETLLGSAEKANERIASIVQFAAKTPFELTDLVEASRTLEVMAGSAFASERGLTLVGDAASVTNNRIQDVAFWVGRLVSGLQGGQPFGEASLRLQEMGLLSVEAKQQLERLTGQALSNARVFDILNSSFARTQGGMERLAETFSGRVSNLKESFNLLAGELTEGLFDQLNSSLQSLLEKIGQVPTEAEKAHNKIKALGNETLDQVDSISSFDQVPNSIKEIERGLETITSRLERKETALKYTLEPKGFSVGANAERSLGGELLRKIGNEAIEFKDSVDKFLGKDVSEFTDESLQRFKELQDEISILTRKARAFELRKEQLEGVIGPRTQAEIDNVTAKIDRLNKVAQLRLASGDQAVLKRGDAETGLFPDETKRLEGLIEQLNVLRGGIETRISNNQGTAEEVAAKAKAQALTQQLLKDEKNYKAELEKTTDVLFSQLVPIEEQIKSVDSRIALVHDQLREEQAYYDKKLISEEAYQVAAIRGQKLVSELVKERLDLQAKLDKETAAAIDARTKANREEFNLKLRTEELVLSQIRDEKELAETRSEKLGIVEREREQLQAIKALIEGYAETVKDPALLLSLREQSSAIEKMLKLSEDLEKSRFERSIENFNTREDPSRSFGSAGEAANAGLLDASSEYGNFFNSIYEQVTNLNNAIEGGLSESIKGLLDGTKDVDDAWKSFAGTVSGQVTQALAEMAAKWITNQIRMHVLGQSLKAADTASTVAQAGVQTAALSGPALLQSIVSFGAAPLIGLAGLAAAFVGLPKILGARKDGGPVSVGGTYLVGENGPEYFTAPRDGYITPNHELGKGGGANVAIALFDDLGKGEEWLDTHQGEQKLLLKLSQLSSQFMPN